MSPNAPAAVLAACLLAAAGGTVTLVISRGDCARLAAEAGVAPAELVPGVDARGRPVPPADLDGEAGRDILAAARIVIGVEASSAGSDVYVGPFTFDGAGRLLLNGRPVAADERQRLAAACRATAGEER